MTELPPPRPRDASHLASVGTSAAARKRETVQAGEKSGREPGEAAYTIAMLCLGNICRSPTAQVVLTSKLDEAGLGARVRVLSAGTGDWHLGGRMDPHAALTLTNAGYDASRHRAQQFDASWFDGSDVVLAMDRSNMRRALALAPDERAKSRVMLYRAFDPAHDVGQDIDVPDPWGASMSDYADVLSIVERTSTALVDQLTEMLHSVPG